MAFLFRTLRLLSITVWVGGLVFFAFVVAPIAFNVLSSKHEAGLMVSHSLAVLNTSGHICGLLILVSIVALWFRTDPNGRRFLPAEFVFVIAMMIAAAIVQHSVVPAMERDRIAAGGDIDAAPVDNPARLDFERLHSISEKLEGAALLMGLITVVLIAAERSTYRGTPAI